MATATADTGATDTRARLVDVAVGLFMRHSFAGTSLQMIADAMGLTKAAIYHHFRTREQLLAAVVEPIFDQLRTIIATAEAQRGRHARAEHMLHGYAALAVANRALFAILAGDPSVAKSLHGHPEWSALIERQLALLADVEPGAAGRVKATVVLAGMAGAVGPTLVNLDEDELREHLVEAGRRTLGLRRPQHSANA
jgi:AcrR family transcriptional regulator